MVNIINAIIIDTFMDLRKKESVKLYNRNSVCFICSVKREFVEINGGDFDYHIKEEHNVRTYFNYLMKISVESGNFKNNVDSHVNGMMMRRKYDFFPSFV